MESTLPKPDLTSIESDDATVTTSNSNINYYAVYIPSIQNLCPGTPVQTPHPKSVEKNKTDDAAVCNHDQPNDVPAINLNESPVKESKSPEEEVRSPFVFTELKEALSVVKDNKAKGARFKQYRNYSEACHFTFTGSSGNDSSLVVTPKRLNESASRGNGGGNNRLMPSPNAGIPDATASSPVFGSPNEPDVPFDKLTRPDLSRMKRAIEQSDFVAYKEMVEANPRYLINVAGYAPTIVFEGCRYNALHIACRSNNLAVVQDVLQRFSDSDALYVLRVFPDDEETSKTVNERLLDAYLNTPDKNNNHTPLHMAAKLGNLAIIRALLASNKCDVNAIDKYGKRPVDLVSGSVRDSDPGMTEKQALDELVALLNSNARVKSYYVALYRNPLHLKQPVFVHDPVDEEPAQFSEPPIIACTTSLSDTHLLPSASPLCPSTPSGRVIHQLVAYIGPMTSRDQADTIHRRWKHEQRQWKRSDSARGWERLGRLLAHEIDVGWRERWPLLHNAFYDLCTEAGLSALNQHLKERHQPNGPAFTRASVDMEDEAVVIQHQIDDDGMVLSPKLEFSPSAGFLDSMMITGNTQPRRLVFEDDPEMEEEDRRLMEDLTDINFHDASEVFEDAPSHKLDFPSPSKLGDISDICNRLTDFHIASPPPSASQISVLSDKQDKENMAPAALIKDRMPSSVSSEGASSQNDWATPPSTPPFHYACLDNTPTAEDVDLFRAIQPVVEGTIQVESYPNDFEYVYKWVSIMNVFTERERAAWPRVDSPRLNKIRSAVAQNHEILNCTF